MTFKEIKEHPWVWVNSPSTNQSDHKYHGMRGIAIIDFNNYVRVYFVDPQISIHIHPKYLSASHIQNSNMKLKSKYVEFTIEEGEGL